MSKAEGYIGTLAVTWESGERNVYEIAQNKGYIWVGDHFVSAKNEKSLPGVLREIAEVMSNPPQKVRQYTWLELITPLKFPK